MSKNLNIVSASGSATGNPRNKTALKPGYSLVGWIRLGSSGEDLTGLKGKTINVSHQELSLHNKREDCWMAVRGRVYNVTRYLDFHPGGSEQLMRGAGIDATKLFDEFHAWVNIDQLLSKCYVGPLRNTVTLNLKDSSSNMDIRTKLSPPSSGSFMKFPSILSASSEALSKTFGDKQDTSPQVQPIEIIPRFDWIQKTSELSIFFYTKSFCNPGVSVENICDSKSEIKIYIANTINSYKFSFLKSLKWPCNLKINQETGKIEIVYEKVNPELWSNFGIFERTRNKDETAYCDYKIVSKKFFNRDSFELMLRPKNKQLLYVPIGYHLNFRLNIGNDVVRSYTPIAIKYTREAMGTQQEDILFLIKTYNNGMLSKYLSEKTIDDLISVSQPKGNFDLNQTKNHTKFGLLAAGSGITPILSVTEYLLERSSAKVEKLNIHFFNKTVADIWLRDNLEALSQKDKRLSITHILSESDPSWQGLSGRVSKEIVESVAQSSTFIFICGPTVFNDITIQYLKDSQFPEQNIHCFQG